MTSAAASDPAPEGAQFSVPDWLELDGVDNMRDLGGLGTSDGFSVIPGRLIRSDNLQELSPASVRHLVDDLGVTDIVDLRTFVEVAKEGDGPLVAEPRVRLHHHTLYTEDTKESGIPAGERELPWVGDRNMGTAAQMRRPRKEERKHDAYWSRHYLGYLAQRPDSVVAALRAVAESDGAVVVHCAAGKDRTGTIVGLALLVAGVTRQAVIADFAASAERLPRILERLARHPAYAANLKGKTVAQQQPRAETMRLLVEALDEQGGPEAWLHRHGWTGADTARLRAKLLSPQTGSPSR
ncbi:MAG: tyrosine-protein phosphatase [Lapillicoccus sp.]